MKRSLVIYIGAAVLTTIFLAGCCGGGDKKSAEPGVVAPAGGGATTGKQLQDLKDAHDQGAITDEEFQKEKEKILKAE